MKKKEYPHGKVKTENLPLREHGKAQDDYM
jgi:hypothetical protein